MQGRSSVAINVPARRRVETAEREELTLGATHLMGEALRLMREAIRLMKEAVRLMREALRQVSVDARPSVAISSNEHAPRR
jgi:hypothetical protein